MNPSIISVPVATGAQGLSVSDYVLDRVSGDVEKNLGQVVEAAFAGASVPLAALLILSQSVPMRRAFIFEAGAVNAGMRHADAETRQGNIGVGIVELIGAVGGGNVIFNVADTESTLKGKEWNILEVTQNASLTGTTGFADLDLALTPARRQLTLAALIAKLEDIALTEVSVAVWVSQLFPEVLMFTGVNEPDLGASDANVVTEFSVAPIAKVTGVFQSVSAEVNPKFGFESGGGF